MTVYQCVYTRDIYVEYIHWRYIGIEIPPTISSVHIDLISGPMRANRRGLCIIYLFLHSLNTLYQNWPYIYNKYIQLSYLIGIHCLYDYI